MGRTRHTPEQIIRKLREAERLLGTGTDVEEVCRSLEISAQTYHRWKVQYQAMRPEKAAPSTAGRVSSCLASEIA